MTSKSALKLILALFVAVGVVISLVFIFRGQERTSQGEIKSSTDSRFLTQITKMTEATDSAAALLDQVSIDPDVPVRVMIPEIDVDARVENVGLTSDGDMDAPKKPEDIAWYEPGPRPGEVGSAVLAGHYGTWENGDQGVFNDLHTLQKGDEISVEDGRGTTTTFVVRESRRFDPEADASAVFFSDDGKSHLNLITCEGDWDKTSQSYSKRLVVFADKK